MGAQYTGAIELRKLLVRFSRGPSGGTQEDFDVITFHFAKITSGAVDANWLAADYAAVESAFDSLWTTLKPDYPAYMVLAEYRWFKDGPVQSPDDLANGPSNPAVRATARAVAGTASGANAGTPPQIAWTVTEVVPVRKRWGRVYMPAPTPAAFPTNEGRIATPKVTAWLAAMVTFYNACRTAGIKPVVWTRGRSTYTTSKGNLIATHPATAYEIDSLQIDNLWDTIRSRRYDGPTVRSITNLT